jgi:hypothetical protein
VERGRLLSLKRKISDGKLKDVAEEIVSIDEPLPEELVASIRDSLAAGTILDSWSLGKLVIRTRDREIFYAPSARAMILSSWDVLCDLLRVGIPDKEIEARLCRELESGFDQNLPGRREHILKALRDCGTVSSLDVLERIEFDFSPRIKVAEAVLPGISGLQPAPTQDFVQKLEMDANVYLGELLKETIQAIRQRNEVGDDLWGLLARSGDPFTRSVNHRERAVFQLENNDLGASLNYLRKATEAMLKTVILLQEIQPDKGESIEKMQLPTLMAILMDKKYGRNPDKTIHKFLEQLRDSSTLGSHDQGEQTEGLVGPHMVRGQIETFDKVLTYFRSYVDAPTLK